jgi:hypothetical protein
LYPGLYAPAFRPDADGGLATGIAGRAGIGGAEEQMCSPSRRNSTSIPQSEHRMTGRIWDKRGSLTLMVGVCSSSYVKGGWRESEGVLFLVRVRRAGSRAFADDKGTMSKRSWGREERGGGGRGG